MPTNSEDDRAVPGPDRAEIDPAADAARRLRDEWQRLARGTGDRTLTRLNELLIKFNHEFHLAVARRTVTNHELRILLDEALPESASRVVRTVEPAASLEVEPDVVKTSLEAVVSQRSSS